MIRPTGLFVAITLAGTGALVAQEPAAARSRVPDWSEQLRIREAWLPARHALLLPMMRRHGIAMWIVVNEEFHDDPVVPTIAPPRPYAGNRDFFIFVDDGSDRLARFSITAYPEENIRAHFEPMPEGRNPGKMLGQLVERFKPATIGLAIDGSRGVTRGLSHATWQALGEWLGPETSRRFVSAAGLIEPGLHRTRQQLAAFFGITNAIVEHINISNGQ